MRRAFTLFTLLLLAPPFSHAEDDNIPVHRTTFGGFSNASAQTSVGRTLGASGRAAVGVSVAPVAIAGSVAVGGISAAGASVNASGQAVSRPAAAPVGTPLPISQEVITITPAPAGNPTPDSRSQPLQSPDLALQPAR